MNLKTIIDLSAVLEQNLMKHFEHLNRQEIKYQTNKQKAERQRSLEIPAKLQQIKKQSATTRIKTKKR